MNQTEDMTSPAADRSPPAQTLRPMTLLQEVFAVYYVALGALPGAAVKAYWLTGSRVAMLPTSHRMTSD